MSSLVPLVCGRNTQDKWIRPRLCYVRDRKLLKGGPGSFLEDSLVLRKCVFCRGNNKLSLMSPPRV